MEINTPNRLSEYNETQRKRAEYIEKGEKRIQELFKDTIEKETIEKIKEKRLN